MPAHARNFIILMILLSCVMRDFTILILLLSGIKLIIDVMRLDAGAMLIAHTRLLMLIQIDGKLGRRRKLGCFIVAIRDGFLARPIIGRRTLLVSVGLSDESGKFCDGIAFSVGSETFVIHRIRSDLVLARTLTHGAFHDHEAADVDHEFQ